MGMDEGSPLQTLSVYEATRGDQDDVFNVFPRDDINEKGPKQIEELVKLQLRTKPGQCTQLSKDLTSHEYRHIAKSCKGTHIYSCGYLLIC